MSDLERPGPESGWQTEFRGRASDTGQVYQAGGSQYISHVHLHGADGSSALATTQVGVRGVALQRTQERVSLLIRTLSLTEAEWQARCAELETQAQRARAEGRAEALAEVQEQLRAAELRVMKAQRMMGEAVREREKAEALLTQAQQELALRRRAEERREEERARSDGGGPRDDEPSSAAHPVEEGEQFTQFIEAVQAELGAVRDDLRLLGEGMPQQYGRNGGAQVIAGESVRRPETGWERAFQTPVQPAQPWAAPTPPQRMPVPGPPRPFKIVVAWTLSTVPPLIAMLIVTANRAAYASHASLWKVIPFTGATLLVGLVALALTLFLAGSAVFDALDRDSEANAGLLGCAIFVLGTPVLLLTAFWTPLTWPGPAGAWGRGLASAMGLG